MKVWLDLTDDLQEDYVKYLPLYKAVDGGDWESAERFLGVHPDAVRAKITSLGQTALHVATLNGNVVMVEKLVQLMSKDDLELTDNLNLTALAIAAISGTTKIAEAMVAMNEGLGCIRDVNGYIPVVTAAYNGRNEMVHFLYSVTPMAEFNPDTSGSNGAALLVEAISAEIYDVALNLLQHYPRLAITKDTFGNTALTVLVRTLSAFPSGSRHGIWKQWVYASRCDINKAKSCEHSPSLRIQLFSLADQLGQKPISYAIKEHYNDPSHLNTTCIYIDVAKFPIKGIQQMYQKKLVNFQVIEILKVICSEVQKLDEAELQEAGVYFALITATEFGIVEFVDRIFRSHSHLTILNLGRPIFSAATVHRQHKVFNLIYGMGAKKGHILIFDNDGNTMLHLAALLSPSSQLNRVSGAALQMQRELQWFKEVEKVVPPRFRECQNKQGKTPQALFTEQHKDLVKEGETWMKDTATSCAVVATLIATIIDTGIPIFLHTKAFMIFIISDAFSLFSSSTSVLMFLAILTSPYAEEDFLVSLPKRLIIGLATLFFSVATMMIAFGATLFIVLHHRAQRTAIPITLLGSVPVALFVLLQFPLHVDMVFSTYGSGIFGPGK
uniref:PGG domain-containing protein n=1 Tax=Nelumbo nucifera TaxID=4432 RepID=A0A822XYZ6_NELNU|nr:TPA_asm: hypothetical protein HUJ06_024081 [Nelumbo nucifera]